MAREYRTKSEISRGLANRAKTSALHIRMMCP